MCERELETEQTPTLLAITAFLSRSPGLLNRGPGGPVYLGAGFLYRTLSLTGLVFKLTDFLSSLSHNFALIQPVHSQGYNILIIPRPDAPVIYTGAFPILTARPGRRSICNICECQDDITGASLRIRASVFYWRALFNTHLYRVNYLEKSFTLLQRARTRHLINCLEVDVINTQRPGRAKIKIRNIRGVIECNYFF